MTTPGPPNAAPAKVPRDKSDDYTPAMAKRRRDFVRERSGVELAHVGHFSLDPATLPGNIENFMGVAQVPIGLAGPLRINGEHAQGNFYVPMATTEGTLVASYNRGMRLLSECGGVKTTVVSSTCSARRCSSSTMRCARVTSAIGSKPTSATSSATAESTTHVGQLINIYQYAVGPLRHLRFNYTTGDAAGQNMTGKATLAACEWINVNFPGGARFLLSGNMDTDKKHSQLNTLVTRGKRVVAEATLNRRTAEEHHGRGHGRDVRDAPGVECRGLPRRLVQQRLACRQRPDRAVHRLWPGRGQCRRVARRRSLHAAAAQRRLLLVDHA